MNAAAINEMIKLAQEDIDTGYISSVYVDGPGWIRIDSVNFEKESGLVILGIPDEGGVISTPFERVVAIKATPSTEL